MVARVALAIATPEPPPVEPANARPVSRVRWVEPVVIDEPDGPPDDEIAVTVDEPAPDVEFADDVVAMDVDLPADDDGGDG